MMKYNDRDIEKSVHDAVERMLETRGLNGWNMDTLSEQAGLAKNTLYKIIGSKEDVIEKVVLRSIREVQTALAAVIAVDDDYTAALAQVSRLFPDLIGAFYAERMREIFAEYPRIEKSVRAHRDAITQSILNFIRKGVACGALRPDLDAEACFEVFQALVLFQLKSGRSRREISQRIGVAFDYVMEGIRAR